MVSSSSPKEPQECLDSKNYVEKKKLWLNNQQQQLTAFFFLPSTKEFKTKYNFLNFSLFHCFYTGNKKSSVTGQLNHQIIESNMVWRELETTVLTLFSSKKSGGKLTGCLEVFFQCKKSTKKKIITSLIKYQINRKLLLRGCNN